jgi:hypothetical protein
MYVWRLETIPSFHLLVRTRNAPSVAGQGLCLPGKDRAFRLFTKLNDFVPRMTTPACLNLRSKAPRPSYQPCRWELGGIRVKKAARATHEDGQIVTAGPCTAGDQERASREVMRYCLGGQE